jgi:acyl-coenzyme A thioesterase PaaI-like protein
MTTAIRSQEKMQESFKSLYPRIAQGEFGNIGKLIQMRFESCNYTDMSYICSFQPVDWMSNPDRTTHGGITATVFDQVMGFLAVQASGGHATPTVSMQVSYLKPMPIGTRVYIRARLTACGRTLCHVTAEAWLEGHPETVTATAMGTYHVAKRLF